MKFRAWLFSLHLCSCGEALVGRVTPSSLPRNTMQPIDYVVSSARFAVLADYIANLPLKFHGYCAAWIFFGSMCFCGSAFAAQPTADALSGRLFYTPQQRAMLGNARTHNITQRQQSGSTGHAPSHSAPLSFDGVITRSDGSVTHWVDGRPYAGAPSADIRGLKPGQIRANNKVYEPYQLLRPAAAPQVPNATADKPPARAQESVDAP